MTPTTKHKLDYCPGCKTPMVRCATCGNNSCNGGYGAVDGSPGMGTVDDHCPDCPDAYDVQAAFNKDPKSVTFDHGTNEELLVLLARVHDDQGDAAPWLTEAIRRGLEIPRGCYWVNYSLDLRLQDRRAKRAQLDPLVRAAGLVGYSIALDKHGNQFAGWINEGDAHVAIVGGDTCDEVIYKLSSRLVEILQASQPARYRQALALVESPGNSVWDRIRNPPAFEDPGQ